MCVSSFISFNTLSVRIVLVVRRPDVVQAVRPVAKSVRGNTQEVSVSENTQSPSGVRVPRGSFLPIPSQITGLGIVLGRAGHQLLPQ